MSTIKNFIKMDSFAGILLMSAAVIALVLANSSFHESYESFINAKFYIGYNDFSINKPLLLWINDGLMAIFFLLIGLELKREFFEGELSKVSQVVLPGFAALGGIVVPALIFYIFNAHQSYALHGWAIPTATDIAFALGILGLIKSRIPHSIKIFLMAVAIFDDLAAILIIAFFYSGPLSTFYLTLCAITISLLFLLNYLGIKRLLPYLAIGLCLWLFVLKSGVHATLAGVVLAASIPIKVRKVEDKSPLKILEKKLHHWVTFFIIPIFAFANSGIPLAGVTLNIMTEPVVLGIVLGLFFGKQLGVFGMTYLCIKCQLAKLPENSNWMQLYGVALLCGVGFTMSLFISGLAYQDTSLSIMSRIGILTGSFSSALIGLMILYFFSPKYSKPLNHHSTYGIN